MTPVRSRTAASSALAVGAALAVAPLSPVAAQVAADTVELQVVGINDFHGHLDPRRAPAPSVAGVLGGAVEQLRTANPNSIFVSAGDNIGASPFISSSQQDPPTPDALDALDALDAMGLVASAVGNHECDRGYADLAGRVADRADFPYLGANVEGEMPELQEYDVVTTPSGVTIGFIGVVIQQTASLVSPSGITGITFTDPVAAADRVATALSDGSAASGEARRGGPPRPRGRAGERHDGRGLCRAGLARRRVRQDPDRGERGHRRHPRWPHPRHRRLRVPPAGRSRAPDALGERVRQGDRPAHVHLRPDGRPDHRGERRGRHAHGDVAPRRPEGRADLAAAQAQADVVGREVIGSITTDIPRAKTAGGDEDRGSESLLGKFIAGVQLAATDDGPDGAQIAFMNPRSARRPAARQPERG